MLNCVLNVQGPTLRRFDARVSTIGDGWRIGGGGGGDDDGARATGEGVAGTTVAVARLAAVGVAGVVFLGVFFFFGGAGLRLSR